MPRNKKTAQFAAAVEIIAADLPEITADDEKFVELITAGQHTQAEAFELAYGPQGIAKSSLAVKACRRLASNKIQAHLRAVRSVGLRSGVLTMQSRIDDELAFAQRCEDTGNMGAAGGAYDRVNKLLGLYTDRLEVTTNADPAATLRKIAETEPELARSLAEKHGIRLDEIGEGTRH